MPHFTGEWNDDKDGEGASYKAGSKIENVFSPIILYAQWEKMTVRPRAYYGQIAEELT